MHWGSVGKYQAFHQPRLLLIYWFVLLFWRRTAITFASFSVRLLSSLLSLLSRLLSISISSVRVMRSGSTLSCSSGFLKPLVSKLLYIAQPLAGAFAYFYKRKHIKYSAVSCITDASGNGLVNTDAESSWVWNHNLTEFFVNDNPATAIVVGMDQGIGQTFSERSVYRGIIDTLQIGIQFKWCLYISSQTVNDFEIDVKYIATPISIAGADTVRPACFIWKTFPVIRKIVWQFFRDEFLSWMVDFSFQATLLYHIQWGVISFLVTKNAVFMRLVAFCKRLIFG